MIRGKKGATEEVVEQIPYIFLTLVIFGGITLLLNYYTSSTIDVSSVQADLFLYRALYEPNILASTDSVTGRVYPGIIEESNFTSAHLDASINYDYEKQITAKFEVRELEKGSILGTAYYNGLWYNRLEPIASGFSGAASAKIFSKNMRIIYRMNGVDIPANLSVKIILPT